MKSIPYLETIALQPTSLCNLNCNYCYLPGRDKNFKMTQNIIIKVVEFLESYSDQLPNPITIIWHAGEPLACGTNHFRHLLEPFAKLEKKGRVVHALQTNATLINDDFCEMFKQHNIRIGVSIDGPAWNNKNRVNWNGKESFPQIMEGITLLKKHKIPFTTIAVITENSLLKAQEIYDFFCTLGCTALGINIEEHEGENLNRHICDNESISKFWDDLLQSWKINPVLEIREFKRALSWVRAVCYQQLEQYNSYQLDIFPTISWKGDVYLLSPEFAGIQSQKYDNFVAGNILNSPLSTILSRVESIQYVVDFKAGVETCRNTCNYFSFCQGGYASNKYFELGSTFGTETIFCRNSKKRLIDTLINIV